MSKMLGQFFTINKDLQTKVVEMIKNDPKRVLEPSSGRCHLLPRLFRRFPRVKVTAIEIDDSLEPVIDNKRVKHINANFLTAKFTRKYDTIIGNPPYVKSSKNLYIQFIDKCFDLLTDRGELIFIIPSDFFKLTSARKTLINLLKHGSFTDVYFPNNENLFENASIDVVVFRYQKGVFIDIVRYNGEIYHTNNRDGLVTFTKDKEEGVEISTMFNVYVGLVTGKENVFKTPKGNIDVLNDENVIDRYIYIEEFPSDDPGINKHMLEHKDALISRKIRKFNENNWYEWGAPRNKVAMEKHRGEPCIYVKTLTRRDRVAFKGVVKYFGGGLLCLIPKKEVDLDLAVDLINSEKFKDPYMYSGRFRIGHRQIGHALIKK